MDEVGRERCLTRRDLEAVIRRAAELEAELGAAVPELSEDDLLRIAAEVGLSESSVRRALAEYRAGSGRGALLAERGRVARLCGPGLVTAARRVERPATEVRDELETHFQSGESLRLVRSTGEASLWEPETGVVATLVRGLDLSGKGYQLAKKSRAVELCVVALGEGLSQVSLTVDLGKDRAGWFWGVGVAVGVPLALAGVAVATQTRAIPDLLALLSPGFLGVSLLLARAGYRRALERVQTLLEGLLDRLERGAPLAPPRPSWRDLLR